MGDRPYVIGRDDWFEPEVAQNYLLYGEVYKDAVNVLIEHFDKNSNELMQHAERFDDPAAALLPEHAFGILPLVYNFRHYIELKLKGLILMKCGRIRNTHNIDELLQKLKEVSSPRVTPKTEEIIKKLQEADNRAADAFRYPYDSEQQRHFKENREFLDIVNDFVKFKEAVSTVMNDLTNVEGDFDVERDGLDASRDAMDFSG
jgi:HEPN domain-containing protein